MIHLKNDVSDFFKIFVRNTAAFTHAQRMAVFIEQHVFFDKKTT
jgi:hypothetical protein